MTALTIAIVVVAFTVGWWARGRLEQHRFDGHVEDVIERVARLRDLEQTQTHKARPQDSAMVSRTSPTVGGER